MPFTLFDVLPLTFLFIFSKHVASLPRIALVNIWHVVALDSQRSYTAYAAKHAQVWLLLLVNHIVILDYEFVSGFDHFGRRLLAAIPVFLIAPVQLLLPTDLLHFFVAFRYDFVHWLLLDVVHVLV